MNKNKSLEPINTVKIYADVFNVEDHNTVVWLIMNKGITEETGKAKDYYSGF